MRTEHGGEILLLTPGWTLSSSLDALWGDSLTCHHVPNDNKMSSLGRVRESPHYALIVTESNVGRFSYSPEAGHLLSSFGAWWRVRESPHHAPNDNERVQTVVRKRISQPCSVVVIQSMVGRFSYSSQVGLSGCRWMHGGEILLLATTRQTTTECPAWVK